eukprot:TRINITY_DN251_c0_g1_i10.p1 TRINITY_DN251_c0_g1~~TRINITY_DN251_c0_g1_i10.p1  ORF type:complete len:133 (-),score=10.69 TRINITY_DN251_c0_g1_i10:45-443(-)
MIIDPQHEAEKKSSFGFKSDSVDRFKYERKNYDGRKQFKKFSVPWARSEYTEGYSIHQEIEDFVAWLLPTKEEREMREDVINRIQQVVRELWPQARVEIIGSYKTDLCVPTRYKNELTIFKKTTTCCNYIII